MRKSKQGEFHHYTRKVLRALTVEPRRTWHLRTAQTPGQPFPPFFLQHRRLGASYEELGARGATKSGRKRALQLRLRALIIRAAGS